MSGCRGAQAAPAYGDAAPQDVTDRCDRRVIVAGRPTRDVNVQVRDALRQYGEATLLNPRARHSLAVAPGRSGQVTIEGRAGAFCGAFDDGADIVVAADAGWALGDGMAAGSITVRGSVGASAGAGMSGGVIEVLGTAGPRCGAGMWGGMIIVHGNVGWAAALHANGGRIVCLGHAARDAGAGMGAGELWVAGSVASVGLGATIVAPTNEDVATLEVALASVGISEPPGAWRLIRRAAAPGL